LAAERNVPIRETLPPVSRKKKKLKFGLKIFDEIRELENPVAKIFLNQSTDIFKGKLTKMGSWWILS
jgi:hypothetical protein